MLFLSPNLLVYPSPPTTMPPPLPSAITEFVESASLDEKQQLLALLTENIAADEASFNTANTEVDDSSSLLNSTDSPGLSRFIEHVDKLDISPELSAGVETTFPKTTDSCKQREKD